jgi:endoglucanase
MDFLKVKGTHIQAGSRDDIMLRGACLGGWLNMENFITGFPGTEQEHRRAIREELGDDNCEAFFRAFLDNFVTADDIAFLKSLGSTVVRLPFGYRHFGAEARPGEYDRAGFHYLDKTVAWAKQHGLYVILDLHAAPLWQSEGWHCDNPHGVSLFWKHAQSRDWVRGLWELIAEHYRDEPAVAGYNLLNEPNTPDMAILNQAYRDWTAAIRKIDTKHIIFLEGNDYARAFAGLDEPFDDNTVYSSHNYMDATHKAETYPGPVAGVQWDKAFVESKFLESNRWLLDRPIPSWIGEFGALYDGGITSPTAADRARLAALADQLEVFHRHHQHWTIWTYKDVDVMGLVAPPADCEYLKRIAPMRKTKADLGIDAWTARGRSPLAKELAAHTDRLAAALPDSGLAFEDFQRKFVHIGYYALTAGFLSPLFARSFKGMKSQAIESMMQEAFHFRNCRKRVYLNEILSGAMQQ